MIQHVASNLGRMRIQSMQPEIDLRKIERKLTETEEGIIILEAVSTVPLYAIFDVTPDFGTLFN